MDSDQINRLITDEVDDIADPQIRKFIRDILAHERRHIDREQYEYKNKYKGLIGEYASGTDHEGESDD